MSNRILKATKKIHLRDLLAPLTFLLLLIPSCIFRLLNKMIKRPLWLVAESGEARDNGYHFFKYVREQHPDDFCFYAIKKDDAEYDKVSMLGNVIKYGSLKHWLYYMSANYNISSQKGGNPCPIFWYIMHVTFGLYRNRVFLQHGVTKDDLDWLYYKKTKFKYFITGTKQEYDYIKKQYGYPDNSVVLTGFPRWDNLLSTKTSRARRSVLVMPTWRDWLGGDRNDFSREKNFEQTEYYKNWNGLLNDEEFLQYIEKNDIDVYFYPHINMQQFLPLFTSGSKNIKLISTNQDIQDYFKKCDIMITDYSSVAFDFAYLDKPVIYYQFDEDEYRSRQYKEGYFNYRRDGFGPVVKNCPDVIDSLCKLLDEKQEKNHPGSITFIKRDGQNSRRVYNALTNKTDKKKILQINHSMDIGGIESFIMNLYRNIDRNKYEFVFLVDIEGKYDYQDEIEKMGGRFVRIDRTGHGNRFNHLLQLNRVIKKERPDVVHCYTYFDAASVMLVAKHNKVPVRITHSHTTQGFGLRRKTLHNILAWIIRKCSTVLLACGNEAGLALYKKECFTVLNNGIDLDSFKFDRTIREKKRKEMGLNKNEKVIGHIGRFAEVKNHSFILDIARELIKQGHADYKFILIGDGPLRKEIEEKIRKKGLQNNVILLGNRSDVSELYSMFDMFIFPSLYEGMPMALIEAQANGLTIISSSNVPTESKINSNFSFVDLDKGANYWANLICHANTTHINPDDKINEYSVKTMVSKITSIYENGGK